MSVAAGLAGVAAAGAAVAVLELAALHVRGRERRRRGGRRAIALRALLLRGARAIGAPPPPPDLAARLAAAGASPGLSVVDAMALKCAAALAGAALALPASALAPGRLGLLALVAAPAAGFLAPDLVLRRRARRRAATIELELADAAELLRVCVDAGLTPARALAEVGRRHPGLLAAELRAAAGRIALGVPRADALAALQARAPLPGVAALVDALARADRHGAPLAPALEALAADARAARSRAVADRAARAAPKIQLVVALLLVPAVLLLVAAALVAAFV